MAGEIRIDPEKLCQKIREIYPDIGACGIDVHVEWDEEAESWVVILEKEGKTLRTHLDPQDIEACEKGQKCIALGIQIGELKKNVGLL